MKDESTKRADKPTVGFHERYASDAEFKRQVDEARRRSATERSTAAFQESLAMTRGKGRSKLY